MCNLEPEPPRSTHALVVVGHPNPQSFNHAIARTVAATWTSLGHEVQLLDLHASGFDPVMTAAEAAGRGTDDEVVQRHIATLTRSDLLCVVHPNCWGSPPAMVKGWIDRVFAENAAFAFEKGIDAGDVPVGLLQIRAALILNTGNTPLDREADHFGDPLDRIWRVCLLQFCGVPNIERRLFGVVATSTEADREDWLAETRNLAERTSALV